MAVTKAKKREVIEKLEGLFKGAASVVFVHFHGYTIADERLLREKLKSEGITYYIAKKTLVARALNTQSFEGERPPFGGELAIVVGVDPIAPAREVQEFAKKSDGKLVIIGGVFDGCYKSATEMQDIASIPSLHVLRGMFVNVINSPIQGLVIALDQYAQKKRV